jgi:hypothetical protein
MITNLSRRLQTINWHGKNKIKIKPLEPILFIIITNNNNFLNFSIEVKMGLKHCHPKPTIPTLPKKLSLCFFFLVITIIYQTCDRLLKL